LSFEFFSFHFDPQVLLLAFGELSDHVLLSPTADLSLFFDLVQKRLAFKLGFFQLVVSQLQGHLQVCDLVLIVKPLSVLVQVLRDLHLLHLALMLLLNLGQPVFMPLLHFLQLLVKFSYLIGGVRCLEGQLGLEILVFDSDALIL